MNHWHPERNHVSTLFYHRLEEKGAEHEERHSNEGKQLTRVGVMNPTEVFDIGLMISSKISRWNAFDGCA